jgi:hypothetical protein
VQYWVDERQMKTEERYQIQKKIISSPHPQGDGKSLNRE